MRRPLCLVRSVPAHGAVGVPARLKTIVLEFNANVVDNAVWNHNKRQINLRRDNEPVKADVIRIPDSIDFSKCRYIYVRPLNKLLPLTTYHVTIRPQLKSVKGQTLGQTVIITFRTGRESEPEE
jgi:hypothetical protein